MYLGHCWERFSDTLTKIDIHRAVTVAGPLVADVDLSVFPCLTRVNIYLVYGVCLPDVANSFAISWISLVLATIKVTNQIKQVSVNFLVGEYGLAKDKLKKLDDVLTRVSLRRVHLALGFCSLSTCDIHKDRISAALPSLQQRGVLRIDIYVMVPP